MNSNFTHLHLHDEYSTLDGFGSPKKWVIKAKKMGFKSFCVTNHGNIDSVIKLQKECKKNDLKLIIGCELYIDENRKKIGKESKRKHINIWVKDQTGWNNLLKMLTIANLEGFSRKPRIDPETLLENIDGLIIGTACLGSFIGERWGITLFKKLAKKIPNDLFIEIMPHNWKGQDEFNIKCLELSKKYNIPLIATNDCHYPELKDNIIQEIQLAIGSASNWNDPKRFRFEINTLYLCSRKKMIQYFKKFHKKIDIQTIEKSLNNTQIIVKKCEDFSIKQCDVHLPLIPSCKQGNELIFFKKIIKRGIRERRVIKQELSKVKKRVELELKLIEEKGFIRYFLIVWELINWCKKNEIMVGPGRGSVGGCLIAYLIGITEVDTLKYNLIFSRFISPERNDLPDIDLDFEQGRRQEVIKHIKHLYGEKRVSQIQTFLSMKGKGVLRDISRTFQVPLKEVNELTKHLPDEELNKKMFFESDDLFLKTFARKYPLVIDYSIRLQGTIRGYGMHSAGVCISDVNLLNGSKCNLVRRNISGEKSLLANWDKNDGEYMGLMKLDVLGLKALDRIHYCLDLIKQKYDEQIDLSKINLEDKEVLNDLNNGKTEGVFQLGSYGLTKFCVKLGISSFKDIYNATALYRPGPLHSGMSDEFVKRKNGKSWKSIHSNVKKLTSETYGILLYQEQVMSIAKELAGFDWGKCNLLRKVIAKSKGAEEFNKYKNDFISGCIEKQTLNKKQATRLFEEIVSFASYGFNLSHSVEYSFISFWDAWLKHYYPLEFYASSLSYNGEEINKKMIEIINKKGIILNLPDKEVSQALKWNIYENELFMPFIEIKGVGEVMSINIEKERKKKKVGFFTSSNSLKLPNKVKKILQDIEIFKKTKKNKISLKDFFAYDLSFFIK